MQIYLIPRPHVCLAAVVPALRRTGHLLAVSGPFGPSQKIESVFAASPETIREKPPEIDSPLLSRLKARPGSLRAGNLVFLVVGAALRSGAALFLGRHKGPLLAIDRE